MSRRRSSSASRRKTGARKRGPDQTPQPPEYLKRLGVHPRKALGQHFLIDEFLLGDIADAAVHDPATPVLEIGAGPGGLTEELAARAQTVVAIELDEDLSALTRERLKRFDGLTVLAADVMEFEAVELLEEAGVAPETPYVAVGNLPYYITQPIVRKLLEASAPPERIVILIQREVAQRIVGGPGKESLLSMSVKMYAEPRILFEVPETAFWPAPKVQSAVIEIVRLPAPALDLTRGEIEAFFHIVRAGFAQPRKQLHNSIVDESGLPRDRVVAMLEEAGVDPVARPQHLGLEDWERIFHAFQRQFPGELDVTEGARDGAPPPFDPGEWETDEADAEHDAGYDADAEPEDDRE
ncbi:MAG: 16S rRNA (adenine(1518)-N(6)/adenine(1519)-N(6))-dimethyltransferase RsmA [Dehalococcoidia bacterium]|nr:16S rRNA (adenine(1518)-N(6)/adenine(1519)-N(6))-dimethyltransferase RsmA [Dehalococcoidia bacterium]